MSSPEESEPKSSITREEAEERINNRFRRSKKVQRAAAASLAGLTAWATVGPPEVHEEIPPEMPVIVAAGAVAVASYTEKRRAISSSWGTFFEYMDGQKDPHKPSGISYDVIDPDSFTVTTRTDYGLLDTPSDAHFTRVANLLSSVSSTSTGGAAGLLAAGALSPEAEPALIGLTAASGGFWLFSEISQTYGMGKLEGSFSQRMRNVENPLYMGESHKEAPDNYEE